MKIQGKYNSAEIFTETIDSESIRQLYALLNNPGSAHAQIAIMPDVHVGKGAVVGLTMSCNDWIIPSIIGVDIGCGIAAYRLGDLRVDLPAFDRFIRSQIPAGTTIHATAQTNYYTPPPSWHELIAKICPDAYDRILASIGTLGGGNHFLELCRDPEQMLWLVVHSGSRNLGLQVCHFHQQQAKQYIKNAFQGAGAYHGMEFMPLNEGGQAYLDDMALAQDYAHTNREIICQIIVEGFFQKKLADCRHITAIHNYVNMEDRILRKGAIAAPTGQQVIIPLNMRDGSLIATGKGNPAWNASAPHGAGRLLSRGAARQTLSLEDYQNAMAGIYSSSISQATIDESPMVYKPAAAIMALIGDSVAVDFLLKPIYNFKAGGA